MGASEVAEKQCTICGASKLLADFYRKKDGKFGRMAHCKECDDNKKSEWSAGNPDKVKEQRLRWVSANPDKVRASAALHRSKNTEERRLYNLEWRERNPELAKAKARRASAKSRSTPQGRIKDAVSVAVRSSLTKSDKRGQKTFALLGYTVDDLKAHLEKHFLPGMTWGNYGKGGWHIDHKIPIAAHNFETPQDIDFKRAWALSNLQPLWERDNLVKGDRLMSPFQPSLAIA